MWYASVSAGGTERNTEENARQEKRRARGESKVAGAKGALPVSSSEWCDARGRWEGGGRTRERIIITRRKKMTARAPTRRRRYVPFVLLLHVVLLLLYYYYCCISVPGTFRDRLGGGRLGTRLAGERSRDVCDSFCITRRFPDENNLRVLTCTKKKNLTFPKRVSERKCEIGE